MTSKGKAMSVPDGLSFGCETGVAACLEMEGGLRATMAEGSYGVSRKQIILNPGMETTDDADDTDMQGLAASVAFTRLVSVFSRIGSSNFLHPRNLCHPWSIPSPFSG